MSCHLDGCVTVQEEDPDCVAGAHGSQTVESAGPAERGGAWYAPHPLEAVEAVDSLDVSLGTVHSGIKGDETVLRRWLSGSSVDFANPTVLRSCPSGPWDNQLDISNCLPHLKRAQSEIFAERFRTDSQ